MSLFYKGRNQKNSFDPNSKKPFRLSRSKIDLFLECQRCFYLDRRLGLGRPPGFPFNLNSAVDHLLKKEFDVHRANQTPHPLMKHYAIDAVPLNHPLMDTWRENFKGVEFLHPATNFTVTGAVDEVWQNSLGELIVVDFKATSKDGEVTLDAPWQISYKRQMEVYQWLLLQNGFPVSPVGYFVYCNGRRDAEGFDGKLEFEVKLIPYEGNTSWIEPTLINAKNCLQGEMPQRSSECDYCIYRHAGQEIEVDMAEPSTAIKKPTKKTMEVINQRSLFGLYE